MSTVKDNSEGNSNQGTSVPEALSLLTEEQRNEVRRIAQEEAERVLDANPYQPADTRQIAIMVQKLNEEKRLKDLGTKADTEINWAIKTIFRTLVGLFVLTLLGLLTYAAAKLKGII